MMYGQMTAGSWIYIGTQGILQGTYETFGAVAKKKFGGTLAGTITLTGRSRRHGRRATAGRHHERRRRDLRGLRRQPHRPPHRPRATSTSRPPIIDDALRWPSRPEMPSGRCRSACSATPPRSFPELLRRGAPIDIVTDQTSAHDPLSYLPIGIAFEDMKKMADKDPVYFTEQAAGCRWPSTSRRWSDSWTTAPRCSTTATPSATRPARPATTVRSTSPASCPPTSGRSSRRASGRSAGRRSRVIPKDIEATDRAILELFPDNEHLQPLDHAGRGEGRLPGSARPHLLARLRRTAQGRTEVQRDGGLRRTVRADRDRPRPPGLRFGGLAVPRDRSDGSTAPTRSPTGRCSTRWSTPHPARRGCRSTTAAASGWAAPSTPGR